MKVSWIVKASFGNCLRLNGISLKILSGLCKDSREDMKNMKYVFDNGNAYMLELCFFESFSFLFSNNFFLPQ